MHIETDFWNFLFGIIVFLLFIYQLVDMVRKRVVPYLLERLQHKDHEQIEVLEREELLSSTRKKIEKKISEQKKIFEQLEGNMQAVHHYQQEKIAKMQQEQDSLKYELQVRLQQQACYRANQVALQEALPRVLEEAEKKIRESMKSATNCGFLHSLAEKN
jgi:exonuclease VII large subunit